MNGSKKIGRSFFDGVRRAQLRRIYRRFMIGAGSAALAFSLAAGGAVAGASGLRGLAQGLAFRGSVLPEGGENTAADGGLSLFLSPSGAVTGDLPLGGLLFSEDSADGTEGGGKNDGNGGEEVDPDGEDGTKVDPDEERGGDGGAGGGAGEDNEKPPEGGGMPAGRRIALRDLSPKRALSLVNMTSSLDPDLEKVYADYQTKNTPANPGADGPLVLILHTHSTESYAPEGASVLPEDGALRSLSHEESVVAVGAALTETLEARGIPAVHCTFGHDLEDYSGAYSREKATILSYLREYPSIRYIFDVHRDSIEQSDGGIVKTKAAVDGEAAAQIMFVVGTSEKGANHPRWEENLGYALTLQTMLSERYPGLMRAVNLRGASFNEQYTPRSLLLEIGSSGNTLAEAKRAVRVLGEAIADEILGENGE